MPRRQSDTVEYFPHFTKSGKTLYILESRWGNDGYAFWFKLLEILGNAEGHFYNCRIKDNWEYLIARAGMAEEDVVSVLEKLTELGNLDRELWEKERIIWCDNFVANLKSLYLKRRRAIPGKPRGITVPEMTAQEDNCTRNDSTGGINPYRNPQRKVKKSKEKKSNNIAPPAPLNNRPIYHLIKNAFLSQAPQNGEGHVEFDFRREGPHIKELEGKALARASPEDFIKMAIVMFWHLVHSEDKFWRKQPFLPSVLNSGGIWPRVLKELENHREKQMDGRMEEIIKEMRF